MASSVPVVELEKKRKPEESSNDAVSKCSDDEPYSDFACEAPAGGNTGSTVSGKRLQSGIQTSTYVKSNTPLSSNSLSEESANEDTNKQTAVKHSPGVKPPTTALVFEAPKQSKSDLDGEEATALEKEVQPTNSSASVTLSSDAGVQKSGPQSRKKEDEFSCNFVDTWSPLESALSYALIRKERKSPNTWVFGNSLIREAVFLIKQEPSLLVPGCMNFHWLGIEDLSVINLRNVIVYSSKTKRFPPPDYLVVHAGGNDLLNLDLSYMTRRIRSELQGISKLFPQAFLFWSEIIPRRRWIAEGIHATSEISIKQLNGTIRAFTKTFPRIQTIRHGLLFGDNFFQEDGVHLSKAGSRVFISNIVWAVRLASLSTVTAETPVDPQAL